MRDHQYKYLIKDELKEKAFKEFKHMQSNNENGKNIHLENFRKPQQCMKTNKLNNNQLSTLFNLRCQSARGIKLIFIKNSKIIVCLISARKTIFLNVTY